MPWGFPWHGLLNSPGFNATLRVGDAGGETLALSDPRFPPGLADNLATYASGQFGAPTEDLLNVHLVRVPGIAPVTLSPAEEAEQTALGRAWRHYGLLVGSELRMHGKALGGWVCIDPAGARWLIRAIGSPNLRYGDATIGSSLRLRFEVLPFGYIGQAAATPVEIETTLADIQQDGETLGGEPKVRMRPASIASHGREVLIALYPKGDQASVNDFACGWLKLTLTGNGPAFGLSLSVLHSRADCLGNTQTSDVDARTVHLLRATMSYQTDDRTLTGSMTGVELIGSSGGWIVGTRTASRTRTGRILSLVYDDSDQIITLSADQSWTQVQTHDAPAFISASGSLVANFPPGQNNADADGRIDYSVSRAMTASETHEVTIKRNGATVDQGRLRRDWSGSRTEVMFFEAAGGYPATLSPAHIEATALAPVWADGLVRADAFTVNGGLAYSYTSPADQPTLLDWNPYAMGARVGFTAYTNGQYTQAIYEAARVNNQIVEAQHSLYNAGTGAQYLKQHRAIAAHATWDNPSSEADLYSLTGAYHPLTHELIADATGTLGTPVFI